MNLVEALDAWIDERIDDLSDTELEQILEIHDAVSASELADVDANNAYNDDVYELVEAVGGDDARQLHTEDVLRAAFFGDPLPTDLFPQDDSDEVADDEPEPEDGEVDDDTAEALSEAVDASVEIETETDVDDAGLSAEDEPASEAEEGDESVLLEGDSALVEDRYEPTFELDEPTFDLDSHHDSEFLAELATASSADEQLHNDFLADVAQAQSGTTARPTAVTPIELREGDALGPSFLTSSPEPEPDRTGAWKQWAVGLVLLAALGVFIFGSLQLFGQLSESDEVATETSSTTPTETATEATPTPDPEPTAEPEPAAAAEEQAEAEPTPAPTAVPEVLSRIGIRLVTGDVMMASFADADSPGDLTLVYDISDDDIAPARAITWLDDQVGVVDAEGSVLLIDPAADGSDPELIYEAGGGLGEAVELAVVGDRVVVRTNDGDVTLVPDDGRADPDVVEFLWDASEDDTVAAADIAAVGDLVAIVLEDGFAQIIDTSDDNELTEIWDDEETPAFNIDAASESFLLGVGQGEVHRYRLDDSRNPIELVWDPSEEEIPAAGYTETRSETALLLADGSIVLPGTDADRLWDAEVTEIRVLAVAGSTSRVAALLESGSVIRIPLDSDEFIASIWDITDVTLDPANQVIIEPPDGE